MPRLRSTDRSAVVRGRCDLREGGERESHHRTRQDEGTRRHSRRKQQNSRRRARHPAGAGRFHPSVIFCGKCSGWTDHVAAVAFGSVAAVVPSCRRVPKLTIRSGGHARLRIVHPPPLLSEHST
mmetsp:Transcript_22680/g.45392  ORF Transcript_22680/g.45392 Transcript_22680/m.45392 type:complete len:124 (-) Transcript_22680:53-424(-)